MEEPLLAGEQLTHFRRLLKNHRRKRVDAPALWRAFAAAFPHRPSGPSERQLLLAALHGLEREGVLKLPSLRGRWWDRTLQPAVPRCVELIQNPVTKAPDEWRRFPWHTALQWVPDLQRLSPEQIRFLDRVHRGLVDGHFRDPAPLKYRSLQLTGDEKRLGGARPWSAVRPGPFDLGPSRLPAGGAPAHLGGSRRSRRHARLRRMRVLSRSPAVFSAPSRTRRTAGSPTAQEGA